MIFLKCLFSWIQGVQTFVLGQLRNLLISGSGQKKISGCRDQMPASLSSGKLGRTLSNQVVSNFGFSFSG